MSTDLQPQPSNLPAPQEPFAVDPWVQPPPGETRSPVRRFLAAILRYRWLVLGSTALAAAAGLTAWEFTQPQYRAQGSLWINQNARTPGGAGPIRQGGLLQSYAWIDLINSFAVLDPVVIEGRLYLAFDPADEAVFESFRVRAGQPFRPGVYDLTVSADGRSYALTTRRGLVIESGAPGGAVGASIGFDWTPPAAELTPERTLRFSVVSPRDASVRLRESIETRMDELGTFIQLGFSDVSPERAASVLESLMQRTVDVAADMKRSDLDEANRILSAQLAVVEHDLNEAERQLESFRVETITLPTDAASPIAPGLQQTSAPVITQFFQLRLELDALRQDRERIEEVLASADGSELQVNTLELIPSVRTSSELVRYLAQLTEARTSLAVLSAQYTDQFEGVRAARESIRNLVEVSIPEAALTVVDRLKSREAELDSIISSRSTELEEIPPRMIEEARLARRVQIANALYIELRQRFQVADLASRSSAPDVQILDRPVVPNIPNLDTRIRFAGMAFAGILGLAVGLVFLLDRMDPRLRDPLDVTGEIGLPILGAVPHLKPRLALSESQVREAFRELRVNVEYAHGTARPLVLCVTSPAEQEGKSFVCANLAIAFSGLGRRTLLVDGDTRRGNAHELLHLSRKPGLTDYLAAGDDGLVHAQQSQHENLWLMPSGARRAGSPELLNSRAMQDLLASARRSFDVIVLDSPPLSAGADAFVLAAHAGSLVLVVRSGATNKGLTMVKLEPFLRLPVRILGAVLNDFVPSAVYGNYRYYGDYIAGYEARDEAPDRIGERAADTAPPVLTS
jgi:capsular exopolysaccharide synthesis family protein